MGIQRFGAHLKPFAAKSVLGSTEAPAQGTIAIIDGPGFAHHVYYKLCAERDRSVKDITYSDVVEAIIQWLDSLSSIGYPAQAIFFDGALPESKRDVRMKRLQNYLDRLQSYRQSSGNGSPSLSGQTRRSLPPPAFLVFAVAEELSRHEQYANVTYVVPGEADGYCVAAAKSFAEQDPGKSIGIFSDDADLLVFGLPSKACVIPFRDMFESRNTEGLAWSGELYWSADIVKQLSDRLPDLTEPAFFMAQDPHCDLKQAYRKVERSDPSLNPEFARFANMYELSAESAEWNRINNDATKSATAHVICDSRVNELIHQLSQPESGLRMYLPVLLEDVSRATAWNVGVDIRVFAYSVLFRAFDADTGVQEYRRSGMRVASTSIDGVSAATLDERLDQLVGHIEQVHAWAAEDAQLRVQDAWRYLVMQHTVQYLDGEGYSLPSIDEVVHIITSRLGNKWHLFHLSAQYQAAYYSFRILGQVVAHIPSETASKFKADAISRLHDQLRSLPRIAAFFATRASKDNCAGEEEWREHGKGLLARFQSAESRRPIGKKRRKRKASDHGASTRAQRGSGPTTNAFAMLAEP